MRAHLLIPLLGLAGGACQASNCEALREQIGAKIRAAGVADFTLVVVGQGAQAPGRVVGTCDRGSRKIVYTPGGTARDAILTECKDGTVTVGGRCGR